MGVYDILGPRPAREAPEQGGNTMDFQISSPVPNVWRLSESGAVTLYLVAGRERAALIDTGFDKGELPDIVRSLTPLPVMLIHSHADLDHIVGDAFWDEAWIHPADMAALRAQPYGERMTLHPRAHAGQLHVPGPGEPHPLLLRHADGRYDRHQQV